MKIPGGSRRGKTWASAKGLRFAVVVSRFNAPVTESLLEQCLAALKERGARPDDVKVVRVPGAFELPLAAHTLARQGRWHAVIALGCILRGETPHDRYIAWETARGLGQTALDTGVPVSFGVLTPLTPAQAKARAGTGPRNKGREAALAAVEMAHVMKALKTRRGKREVPK